MKASREYTNKHRITIGCLCLTAVAAVLYLYFLNMSVVHVVMRQEAITDSKELETEIAVLESEYIDAQHIIATRISELDGYSEETDKIFVSRTAPGLVLRNQ